MATEEIIERFEDYAILVELSNSHLIGFTVSRIVAERLLGGSEISGAWLYESGEDGEHTADFGKAERFLSGGIKWDGCSNWDFHTNRCAAHFCGRKDALSIGRLLSRLYDIAAERLPTYDKSLAEE